MNFFQNLLNFSKKRIKCNCDSGLNEEQTCSKALKWLSKKYKASEFSYLKATYEKISSENKLTDPEHHKQI